MSDWLVARKEAGYDAKDTLLAKLPEVNKSLPPSSSDIFSFCVVIVLSDTEY